MRKGRAFFFKDVKLDILNKMTVIGIYIMLNIKIGIASLCAIRFFSEYVKIKTLTRKNKNFDHLLC